MKNTRRRIQINHSIVSLPHTLLTIIRTLVDGHKITARKLLSEVARTLALCSIQAIANLQAKIELMTFGEAKDEDKHVPGFFSIVDVLCSLK